MLIRGKLINQQKRTHEITYQRWLLRPIAHCSGGGQLFSQFRWQQIYQLKFFQPVQIRQIIGISKITLKPDYLLKQRQLAFGRVLTAEQ